MGLASGCVSPVSCGPIGPDDVQLHLNPLVEAISVIQGNPGGKKAAAKSGIVSFGVRNEEAVIYGW